MGRLQSSSILGIGLGLLALWSLPALGADVALRAEVDRNHVELEEQIQLEVTVEGRFRSVQEPVRPPLDDFEIYLRGRTQGMQIVNGEFTSSNVFNYVVAPKREGKLTIGPFVLRHGGQEYKSEPIRITVGGTPRQPSRGDPSGQPTERSNEDVFVVARVDKQHAYVNEQVIFTFYLYRALQVSNVQYTQPSFQGFWVEKLEDSEKQYYKIIRGRRYSVTELSTAIFPTTSGTLSIDPATLRVTILKRPYGFGFFDRGTERRLRTEPVAIEVSPLPTEGRPKLFDGAVGENLKLGANVEPQDVEEGEPVTLTVRVEGIGNVKTFSKPRLPPLPAFKVYDTESKTHVQGRERVSGSRTFEMVLVPRDEGEHRVPPVRLVYFDTREAQYRTLQTKPVVIRARPSSADPRTAESQPHQQQDIRILGQDIAHIRTDVEVSDTWTPLYLRGLFGVLLPLPLLAVAVAGIVRRRHDRLNSDTALVRSSRARKLARRRLSAARAFMKAGEGEPFYAEVSRALLQYSGDKLNLSAAGLTHTSLQQSLVAAGASSGACDQLVDMLERCDAARFAPGSYGSERLRETLREAEALLIELDGSWSAGHAPHGVHPSVVVVFAGLVAAAVAGVGAQAQTQPPLAEFSLTEEYAPPEQLLAKGHSAYESGDFATAINQYRRAERAGVRNGPLYYNLGNAYYKNGELGHAVASYRRAEMLAPRDPLLRDNLAFVLAQREDKPVERRHTWVTSIAQRLFFWLSLNEWLALGAALYAWTCGLWVARILMRRRPPVFKIVLHTFSMLLLLTAGFVGFKWHSIRGVERGVVTTSRISVMSGPGLDYTEEFSLHEGAEVRVELVRPDWLRVSMGASLRGWIPATSIERI